MTDKPDLSSDGPGSPVSMRKFIEAGHAAGRLTIVLDRDSIGILPDDPNTVNVLVTDREAQATYFLDMNLPMPPYLRKYLAMLYDDERLDDMYKHARTNKALKQMIGLIQILAGSLKIAKKVGKGVRFYIEEPETHLHPQQQRLVMDMVKAIGDEYFPEEPRQEAAAP